MRGLVACAAIVILTSACSSEGATGLRVRNSAQLEASNVTWNSPPRFEPVVVPTSIVVGTPATFEIVTLGGVCSEPATAEVLREPRDAEPASPEVLVVRPYDIALDDSLSYTASDAEHPDETFARVCPSVGVWFKHRVTLTFDEPGPARFYIRGAHAGDSRPGQRVVDVNVLPR